MKVIDDLDEEEKIKYGYAGLLIISIVAMILIILYGSGTLNFTLILLMSTLKFISGFGITLSILSGGIFLLDKISKQFRGKKNKQNLRIYQIIMLIIPLALLIYKGPIKLYQSATSDGEVDNIFDKVLFIYGIASLLLTLYIIPLIKDKFFVSEDKGLWERVKDKATEKVRGVKKGWFKMIRSYGKVQLQDQLTIKDHLEFWKQKFAVLSLFILGFGTLIFTPISIVFILIWLRFYIFDKEEIYQYERYLLIVANIAALVIAILIPFVFTQTGYYQSIRANYFWVDLGYFLGLCLGTGLYITKFLNLETLGWFMKSVEGIKAKVSTEEKLEGEKPKEERAEPGNEESKE